MSIPLNNIIRSATRQDGDRLNILWFPLDGIFETLVCPHMSHNFYYAHDIQYMPWDTACFPPSENMYRLVQHNSFSMDVEFDLIVCNNRFAQFNQARNISNMVHVPVLCIEHAAPLHMMKREDIFIFNQENKSDFMVVCNNVLNELWNLQENVLSYPIPIIPTQEKENGVLIVGKFSQQDQKTLNHIIGLSPVPIKVVGDNPGLSKPCTPYELTVELARSSYYLNLSSNTTTPLLMLMAMGAGCIPISNNSIFTTQLLNDLLNNGILFDGINDLIDKLGKLSSYKHETSFELIEDRFNQNNIQQWVELFNSMTSSIYIR